MSVLAADVTAEQLQNQEEVPLRPVIGSWTSGQIQPRDLGLNLTCDSGGGSQPNGRGKLEINPNLKEDLLDYVRTKEDSTKLYKKCLHLTESESLQ